MALRFKPAALFRIERELRRWEHLFRGEYTPPGPLGPSAPGFTAVAGTLPGQIDMTIHTAPSSAGDATDYGDGLGAITGYVSSIGGVEASHGSSLPITRTASGLAEGVLAVVSVWALGFGGRQGAVLSTTVYPAVTAPSGPSAPSFSFSPGTDPGEVDLYINGPPTSLGDGLVAGDGLGVITGYDVQIGEGAIAPYDATTPREITSGGHTPGASVSATVRARGYGGRPGAVGFATTTATAAAPTDDFITLVDQATGHAITSGGVVWAVRAPEEI